MKTRERKLAAVAAAILAILTVIPSVALADVDAYVVGVDGMACPFCAYGIEKKLEAIDGVDDIEIRIKESEVDVPTTKTVTPAQINEAIDEAGFAIRELRLRGTGDVTTDGSPAIEFSPELSLPLDGFEGASGRYAVEGSVVQRGDRWVLEVAKSREAK